MEEKIKLVLHNVQQNVSCHQKYLKVLENYYDKISNEDFLKMFFTQLRLIFHMDITVRNPYVERTLDFLAQFVCALIKPSENELEQSLDEESPSHPFLTQVICETLKYHDLVYIQTRYYSCRFVTLILKYIGYETHLDGNICDSIQEAMLERTLDPKASIRLQAVMALVRLQEPLNPDCPVIKAYQSLLTDANPLIRKEVVKMIAPNATTRPKISERINDVDYHVRMAAYARCADIGPMLFKIIIRQQILKCGFCESNKQVKNIFYENLLPKWLTAYNGDFLTFLSGLKLDADENDILNTEEISKRVMEAFFKSHPIKDIIDFLPLDNNKLISLDNMSSEVISYWSILSNFLRSSDETEEYLEDIIPELTPFCNYIQNIIDSKTSKTMQEWEYLDFQHILYNLFDMAEQYDLSDEVGRRTFLKLIMSTLQNHKLQFRLVKKVVIIADKLFSNVGVLSNEVCQIISDIREPLVDKPTLQVENADKNFQMAELKVKANILQGELEDALDNQDFQKASKIKDELIEYKRKLEDLNKPTEVLRVRLSKDDPETVCRCLDLLTALLLLPNINVLSPSLETCKSEFVIPLLTSNVVEINWRVLKCLTLYSFLDKTIAEEHLKVLCIPIATYRAIPNYNKYALIVSVSAICDLMLFYGPEIFGEEDTNSTISTQNTTRRRLYRNEGVDNISVVENNKMNVEFIIEIILDMLDDENEEIRETAVTGITKLILTDLPVNPLLMSRIILKWFNPLTGIADASVSSRAAKPRILDNEKTTDKVQQKLGLLISNYTKLIKGAREVIEKAVIPTLTSIVNAPRSSPLADVDMDNVLRFLAAITDSSDTMDIVNIHVDLAQLICIKIASKPSDPVVPYLSKMLLYLEISSENPSSIKELITQAQLLLEEEEDSLHKGPRKNIMKFIEKLKATQNLPGRLDVIVENNEENIEQTGNDRNRDNSTRGDEEVENEYLAHEKQNDINILADKTDENGAHGQKLTEKDTNNINSEKTINKDNTKEAENNARKENNTIGKSNSNNIPNKEKNKKRVRRKGTNEDTDVRKSTTKDVENSTSDTDQSYIDNNRRSKRLRKHTDRLEINHKQSPTVSNSNNTESDDDSEEFQRRQPPRSLKKTNLDKKSANEKALGRRNSGANGRDMADNDRHKSKLTKGKRPREAINKQARVTEKRISDSNKQLRNQKSLIITLKNMGKKKNVCSSDTTDQETEGPNRELRRSKRCRQSLDISDSSNRSRDSEKENSQMCQRVPLLVNDRINNNSSDIRSRRSNGSTVPHTNLSIKDRQPVAESTRNNSDIMLRNSTINATNEIISEMNINGVKRRKSRGKKSQDLNTTGDTTLHTILEQSLPQMEVLDDMTIHTPTSNNSSPKSLQLSHSHNSSVFSTPTSVAPRRSRVIISETSSDSESGSGTSSIRKSTRKIKKKY